MVNRFVLINPWHCFKIAANLVIIILAMISCRGGERYQETIGKENLERKQKRSIRSRVFPSSTPRKSPKRIPHVSADNGHHKALSYII